MPIDPVAAALRERTAPCHARVETLTGLLDPALSVDRLATVLAALYRFWAVTEPQLDRWALASPELAAALDWPRRRRAALLAGDVVAVGGDANLAPQVAADTEAGDASGAAAPIGDAAALGWLYVTEGSTLGGAVLARRLRPLLDRLGTPLRSFEPYSEGPGPMWRSLGSVTAAWVGPGSGTPRGRPPRRRVGLRRPGDRTHRPRSGPRRMTDASRARPDDGPGDLLPPGTPIDLDNCAREPIHVPGSVQPRGALLVVDETRWELVQASANLPELLGVEVTAALGRPLPELLGAEAADEVRRFVRSFADMHPRNPLELLLARHGVPQRFDAILRRDQGLLLLELERAEGPRPFSFPNTYGAVRDAVAGAQQHRRPAAAVRRRRARRARPDRLRPRDDLPLRPGVQRRGRGRSVPGRPQLLPGAALPGQRHPGPGARTLREELGAVDLRRRLRAGAARPDAQPGHRWPAGHDPCVVAQRVAPSTSSTCATWACAPRCRSR